MASDRTDEGEARLAAGLDWSHSDGQPTHHHGGSLRVLLQREDLDVLTKDQAMTQPKVRPPPLLPPHGGTATTPSRKSAHGASPTGGAPWRVRRFLPDFRLVQFCEHC